MSPPAPPSSMISDLRSLPRAFWVLFVGTFINRFGTFVWPFLTIYLTRQGYSLGAAAWAISAVGGGALVGNFIGGWLASKWPMNRLLALAMGLLACSLLALPHVATWAHVAGYAAVMGLAGGFVIVIFFSFWSRAYGRAHLGKIQGAAQALTVVASAVGPLLLAECVTRTGSYAAMFYVLALFVSALALCAWFVAVPHESEHLVERL